MNINEIKVLLEKFYKGETTLDEERLLQKYFTDSNTDNENYAAEKYLFSKLILAENIEMPSNLTKKIAAKIDEETKKNNAARFISFARLRTISVAACLVLMFSLTATLLFKSETPVFIANVHTNETEIIEMLENSFSKISNVVDDAAVLLDITNEQVCELNETLKK
jgi:hypothetical protein